MDMTPQRCSSTRDYLRTVFGHQDPQLQTLMTRAVAAGLPDIAVAPEVGRLIKLLVSTTRARLAIEVGTLAGYSGIWLTRGLSPFPPTGRLITIEPNRTHADFAQREFQTAGLADRIQIRRGTGLQVLPQLARELGPGGVDVVFLDAVKAEYPDYFQAIRSTIAPGGLLIADNALGSSSWWIDAPAGSNPDRDGADRLNRTLAEDPDFEAAGIPLGHGLLVARRMR